MWPNWMQGDQWRPGSPSDLDEHRGAASRRRSPHRDRGYSRDYDRDPPTQRGQSSSHAAARKPSDTLPSITPRGPRASTRKEDTAGQSSTTSNTAPNRQASTAKMSPSRSKNESVSRSPDQPSKQPPRPPAPKQQPELDTRSQKPAPPASSPASAASAQFGPMAGGPKANPQPSGTTQALTLLLRKQREVVELERSHAALEQTCKRHEEQRKNLPKYADFPSVTELHRQIGGPSFAQLEAVEKDLQKVRAEQMTLISRFLSKLYGKVRQEASTTNTVPQQALADLEAKMESRVSELQAKMDLQVGALQAAMDAKVSELQASMDARVDALLATTTSRLDRLEKTLESTDNEHKALRADATTQSSLVGSLGAKVEEALAKASTAAVKAAEATEASAAAAPPTLLTAPAIAFPGDDFPSLRKAISHLNQKIEPLEKLPQAVAQLQSKQTESVATSRVGLSKMAKAQENMSEVFGSILDRQAKAHHDNTERLARLEEDVRRRLTMTTQTGQTTETMPGVASTSAIRATGAGLERPETGPRQTQDGKGSTPLAARVAISTPTSASQLPPAVADADKTPVLLPKELKELKEQVDMITVRLDGVENSGAALHMMVVNLDAQFRHLTTADLHKAIVAHIRMQYPSEQQLRDDMTTLMRQVQDVKNNTAKLDSTIQALASMRIRHVPSQPGGRSSSNGNGNGNGSGSGSGRQKRTMDGHGAPAGRENSGGGNSSGGSNGINSGGDGGGSNLVSPAGSSSVGDAATAKRQKTNAWRPSEGG